jgi:hypothetical protein
MNTNDSQEPFDETKMTRQARGLLENFRACFKELQKKYALEVELNKRLRDFENRCARLTAALDIEHTGKVLVEEKLANLSARKRGLQRTLLHMEEALVKANHNVLERFEEGIKWQREVAVLKGQREGLMTANLEEKNIDDLEEKDRELASK